MTACHIPKEWANGNDTHTLVACTQVLRQKQMILTSEWCAEHPSAGRNTQHPPQKKYVALPCVPLPWQIDPNASPGKRPPDANKLLQNCSTYLLT